jgi:hypothetical protein
LFFISDNVLYVCIAVNGDGKKFCKMKYLKIQNQGELGIRLVALMGGTTKIDIPHKIGQFGTGLKYAISWPIPKKVGFFA